MTIDKAIKTKESLLRSNRLLGWPEAQEATRLGIEALKRVKDSRLHQPYIIFGKLPGEEEEAGHGSPA